MWTSFLERVIRLSGGTRAGGPPSTAAGSPRRSHLPNQHSRPARTEAATSAAMRDLRKRRRPYTAAATANSTMSCTSSRSHLPAMTRPPRPTSRPRKPRVRPRRERSDVSNATPPGASTTSSHYLPRPPAEPRHDRLNPCPPQRARSEPGGDVDRYVSERLEAPAYTQSPRLSSPVEAPCPRMLRDPDKHASDSFIGFALPGTPNSDSYTCGAARDCREHVGWETSPTRPPPPQGPPSAPLAPSDLRVKLPPAHRPQRRAHGNDQATAGGGGTQPG
jgi:hypothetical protein